MRKKNKELHAQRREEILEAASQCFIEKGIHKANMQEICRVASLSPGQLYRFFKSKDAIILALAEQERQAVAGLIEYIRNNEANVASALRTIVSDLIPEITDSTYARMSIEFVGEAGRNEEVANLFIKIEKDLRMCLEEAIKTSQKTGSVKKSVDPPSATTVILSLFDGLSVRSSFETIKNKKKLTKTVQELIRALLCD